MPRQEWLDMDPAALGSRCLDHLAEIEQQRKCSGNLSGIVSGRIKDSNAVAVQIVKAMIEKLTYAGNGFTLKNENFALKEEMEELKRKERAQNTEILELRKMIVNLQRDMKLLKEGYGPYQAATISDSSPTSRKKEGEKIVKRQVLDEKKVDNRTEA